MREHDASDPGPEYVRLTAEEADALHIHIAELEADVDQFRERERQWCRFIAWAIDNLDPKEMMAALTRFFQKWEPDFRPDAFQGVLKDCQEMMRRR